MKILYISNSIIPSRSANSIHVMKMCNALSLLGHEVLLTHKDSPSEIEKYINNIHHYYGVEELFSILPVKKKHLKTWRDFKKIIECYLNYGTEKNFFYKNQFEQILSKTKPQLVVTRCVEGAHVSCVKGYKVIYEAHTPLLDSNKQERYERRVINKIIKYPNFVRLIVITQKLKDEFVKLGVAEDKIKVLSDASDEIITQERVSLSTRENALQVGYVGHLYKGKGLELIQKIAPFMAEIDFNIIGGLDRDIEYWKNLINLPNVKFHGFVPQNEISKYINALDICLLPNQREVFTYNKHGKQIKNISEYTSPLKLFEYMAHGKPIIASDLKVLREILNEDNAILVDPEKPKEWIDAINSMKNDTLRSHISTKAYDDFINNYTWEKRAKKITGCLYLN